MKKVLYWVIFCYATFQPQGCDSQTHSIRYPFQLDVYLMKVFTEIVGFLLIPRSEFPDAHIIGTDISPMQPTWVPPQLTFEMVDMENPWEDFFKPNIFDYIHLRTMAGCFKDWDEILLQALK